MKMQTQFYSRSQINTAKHTVGHHSTSRVRVVTVDEPSNNPNSSQQTLVNLLKMDHDQSKKVAQLIATNGNVDS